MIELTDKRRVAMLNAIPPRLSELKQLCAQSNNATLRKRWRAEAKELEAVQTELTEPRPEKAS